MADRAINNIVEKKKELLELEVDHQIDEFKVQLHSNNIAVINQEIKKFLEIQKQNQDDVEGMKGTLDDMTSHYKDLCLEAVRRELEYNRYQGQILACDSALSEIQEIYNGIDKKLKDKIAEYNEKIKDVERKRGNRVDQLKRLANEFESKVGRYQEIKVELVELDARINVLSNVVSKVSDLTDKQAKCKELEQNYQKMLNHYKQSLTEGVQEETRALIYSTHVENLSSRFNFDTQR